MSWRDNSSSSNPKGVNDGSGGSMNGGGSVSGTGGGGFGGKHGKTTGGRGGYTFRGVPGSRNKGNWNTGGPVVGTGSIMGGIKPARVALPRAAPRPTGFMQPPIVPPVVAPPIPLTYPPVSGPPTRVDLNPATLAPWTGVGIPPNNNAFKNPNGNYSAQYNGGGAGTTFGAPDPSANYGNDQYGHSLGNFGPSQNKGPGVGGGFGGGGGGGW